MNRLFHRQTSLLALGVAGLVCASLRGQTVSTSPLPAQLPALGAKCPVDTFRELLAMGPAERARFLTNRSVVSQKLVLAKLREYEGLSADQQGLRLQATELRWYLLPLMSTAPTNRAPLLARLPAGLKESVETRLQLWDGLTPDVQKRFLDAAASYYARQAAHTPDRLAEVRDRISPARRQLLERGIQQWQEMSEQQRQDTVNRFYEFFNLTPQEKARTLRIISEPERLQIEKTLRQFENLTDTQREQCVLGFEKFAGLSVEERQQFLENAERWAAMSPSEREHWRKLVENLSHRPPVPRGLAALRNRRAVVTNSD